MATQPTHTICIIDDEAPLREVVRRYLEHDSFRVIEADSGPHALTLLGQQAADLLLLDIMLPGIDGFGLMRILRTAAASPSLSTASGVPVIMLTSRGDESDRIAGFELGVDDYVTKPFSPRELVARIKAVLRRSYSESEKSERPLQYGALLIDPIRRLARHADHILTLTAREFDLLWLLAQHPQQVFTRDQLLDRVWGYEFDGDDSTVTVHIRRLREKLERDPSNPIFIQTVWGVGYKFDPPIDSP